jgi:uncharacterized membrane protein YoaK (UPF0700 family)
MLQVRGNRGQFRLEPESEHTVSTRSGELLLLTWAAGALDALCYLRAHVFAANMTGNIVLLGLDVAHKGSHRGAWNTVAIGSFALGVYLAGMASPAPPKTVEPESEFKRRLTLELAPLVAFSILFVLPAGVEWWARAGLILTGAAAMGLQSVAVRRLRLAGVVTTFITGTITTAVVEALSGGEPNSKPDSPLMLVLMLVVYVTAAATAAMLPNSKAVAFAPAACVAAALLCK